MLLLAAMSLFTDTKALMKSIRRASEASRAGMKTSPNPIIEKSDTDYCASEAVSVCIRSLGKINFIGFSILVATVTMTSEAKTKKQSYKIIAANSKATKGNLPIWTLETSLIIKVYPMASLHIQ